MSDSRPDGFLGRWSRRKLDTKEGRPVEEPAPEVAALALPSVRPPATPVGVPAAAVEPVAKAPPLPTLQDAAKLTQDSDFKPFMARGVSPEVKNLALKKLFADPHFNVMDGMDTYIDDYSIPSPLTPAMVKIMASAKFLGLVDDDEESEKQKLAASAAVVAREGTDGAAGAGVAQLPGSDQPDSPQALAALPETPAPLPVLSPVTPNDDDTHLRLQPDHAAGLHQVGRSAG